MDIGRIFTRSWEIFWNNKVLWIFGVLAGCGSRNPTSSFSGGSNYSGGPGDVQNMPPEMERALEEFVRFIDNPGNVITFIITIFCIVFILYFVTLLVGSVGKAGVIKGVLQVEEGKSLAGFAMLWQDSSPYMMRLFGLNLGISLALFVGMILVFTLFAVFSVFTFGFGLLLLCILIPALFIGAVFVSILVEQANVAVVADEATFGQAVGKSWDIVRGNQGNVIGIGVLIFILRVIVMVVFGAVFLFAFAGVFLSLAVTGASEVMGIVWGMITLGLMISVVYMLANGLLTTYTSTAWTLVYNEATRDMPPSDIETLMIAEKEETGDDVDEEGVIKEE